jgi:hypothetical protein
MSQGILLFAHDSEELRYGVMAIWMSERIAMHLNKPVSIVTDQFTLDNLKNLSVDPTKYFDKIIIKEFNVAQSRRLDGEYIPFKNLDRSDAYDLTPYDETLILDTDISISSDRLNLVWDNAEDVLISNDCIDLFSRKHNEFDFLKDHGIKFHWATEFYFRKSELAEEFFKKCKYIRDNYFWYSVLYGMPNYPVRNDHIWSIAIHELDYPFAKIPRNLRYSIASDNIQKLTEEQIVVCGLVDKKFRVTNIKNQDIHLMNKFELVILASIESEVLL